MSDTSDASKIWRQTSSAVPAQPGAPDTKELLPRYHIEGQTSTVGPRWCIWDGVEGHFARYRNIADEGDAVALCAELNRLDALTRPSSPPSNELVEKAWDEIEQGVRIAMVSSCDCDHPASISPEPEGHELSCRYRVLYHVADKIADLRPS